MTKILPALLLAVLFISCDDKNDGKELQELTFEKVAYEVVLTSGTPISVRGGNRDYSLSVEDPKILDAKVDLSSLIGSGNIVVTGKQKGETTLSVTYNLTHQTVKLKIKVIDNYINLKVVGSNHPALVENIYIFLINDEERSCYFILGEENKPHNIISKGRYTFSTESTIDYPTRYLTLTYASDEKGNFTDATQTDASIAPTSHKFDISDNESQSYALLTKFLHIDWEKLVEEQSDNSLRAHITTIMLNMKEVDTEKEISTVFWHERIPEGILE